MKTKRIISLLLCTIMLTTTLISPAFASEGATTTDTCSTGTINITSDELSPEVQKRLEKILYGTSTAAIGQEFEVATFDDGTVLYAVLVETTDGKTRSSNQKTTSMNYMFYTEGWFGIKKDAFSVNLVCTWYSNGLDSSISNLHGTWTKYDDSFSLSWDKDSNYVAQCLHAMTLNIIHKNTAGYIVFSAMLNILQDPVTCMISYDRVG